MASRSNNVLVVDDEDDIREFISCVIEANFSANVIHARSGNEAIRRMKSGMKFNAIVCDYNMPDGDGGSVFTHLIENQVDSKFILCSSSSPEAIAVLKGKSVDFVQKPFVEETIIKKLQPHLDSNVSEEFCYFRVPVEVFLKLPQLQHEVFVKLSDNKYVKVTNVGHHFDASDIERFKQKNMSYLFVRSDDLNKFVPIYKKFVLSTYFIENIPIDRTYEFSESCIELLKETGRQLKWSDETKAVANQGIQVVLNHLERNPNVREHLEKFKTDQYSYETAHSILIAYISVAICSRLDMKTKQTAYIMAMASLMHDITLDEEQLQNRHHFETFIKKGEIEIEDVKKYLTHPEEAAKIIDEWDEVPSVVGTIIRQHHEKPDGSGFPQGCDTTKLNLVSSVFIFAQDVVEAKYKYGDAFRLRTFLEENEENYHLGEFARVYQAALKLLNEP